MKAISGKISVLLAAVFAVTILSSCASTKIQTAEVFSAPLRSPAKILDTQQKGSFELNAQFSFDRNNLYKQNIGGHTNVDQNGVYVLEEVENQDYYIERKGANQYNYQKENLTWHVPGFIGMVDFEYYYTDKASIYGGLNISTIKDETYIGEKIGLAFNSPGKLSLRLSSDVRFQQCAYNVQYLRVDDWRTGSDTRTVRFFNKSEKTSYATINFGIGVNTNIPDWLVNFFASYSFGLQKFFEVDEFTETEAYSSISAGIYKKILDQGRLIVGTRYTTYSSDVTKMQPHDFFIQYDFILK